MKIKFLIVEDEIFSIELLKTSIYRKYGEMYDLEFATSVKEAVLKIQNFEPQLVLLDIQLSDGTGFDILEKIEKKDFFVIFTTAYDDYAIKAFKFSAIDYLLKPINENDLFAAIDKALSLLNNQNQLKILQNLITNVKNLDYENIKITLTTNNNIEFVKISEIIRLESTNNYTTLFTKDKRRLTVCRTLKDFETILKEYKFIRVHQSHLINIRYIKKLVKGLNLQLIMEDNSQIPVSRRNKELLINLLKDNFLY